MNRFLPLLALFLLLPTPLLAASWFRTIRAEWEYQPPIEPAIDSFVLYRGQNEVCRFEGADTTDPAAVVTIMDAGTMQTSADLKSLLVRIAGGTDGHVYKLSFRAATSADNVYEQDILVMVAEV